jgi:hypothetical protein
MLDRDIISPVNVERGDFSLCNRIIVKENTCKI